MDHLQSGRGRRIGGLRPALRALAARFVDGERPRDAGAEAVDIASRDDHSKGRVCSVVQNHSAPACPAGPGASGRSSLSCPRARRGERHSPPHFAPYGHVTLPLYHVTQLGPHTVGAALLLGLGATIVTTVDPLTAR